MRGCAFGIIFAAISAVMTVPAFAGDTAGAADKNMASAGDVVDKKTLKSFVLRAKSYIEAASTPSELFAVLRELRVDETWRKDSIYLFILQRPTETGGEIVIFNASNRDAEGGSMHVLDIDGTDVGHEFEKVVYEGGDGYIEYSWDNPAVSGDELNEPGKVAGTSRKLSYAVDISLIGHPEDLMLGAGFYLDPPPASKKGCSVAAPGSGTLSQSFIFNLFLVVSGLFLAVSRKSRPEKMNSDRGLLS